MCNARIEPEQGTASGLVRSCSQPIQGRRRAVPSGLGRLDYSAKGVILLAMRLAGSIFAEAPEELGLLLLALNRKTSGIGMEHCMNRQFGKIQDWEAKAIKSFFKPAKLASLCSLSLRQLERKFRLHLKMTPREWLREVQCLLARQLIEEGWTSKKVAKKLKFASQAHFSREFKKSFGVNPRSLAPRLVPPARPWST